MDKNEIHLKQTIEYLRKRVEEKFDQIRRDLTVINGLEAEAGASPRTSLLDVIGKEAGKATGNLKQSDGEKVQVADDEFLGMLPIKAAKLYMRKVGRAVSVDEIAAAVEQGAAGIRGADWKEKLEESLTRSVWDVVKAKEGFFGLKDFYTEDQLRSLRSVRSRAVQARPKKPRRVGVGREKPKKAPALLPSVAKEAD